MLKGFHELKRLIHFGPLIALGIIFYCYATALVASYLWYWPPQNCWGGVVNLVVLTFWLWLILRNFFFAIFIGPGYVPLKWRPSNKESESKLQYCAICHGFKPPRSHHCRKCNRCVMKMEHHCPWINNCCGHRNHTYFILFLFFAPVGCLHSFVVCLSTILYQLFWKVDYLHYTPRPVHFTVNAFLLIIFSLGLSLGTIIAVGILLHQQIKVVSRNRTGIEEWIEEKARGRTRHEDEGEFIYPYDLGRKKNFAQVLNWSLTPCGDGYTWPVTTNCDQYTLTVEQMKQKAEKRERLVEFMVVKPFNGWWITFSHGIKTCACCPISDEPRIKISPGDIIVVSRGNKYWLYGDKVLSVEDREAGKRVRGWFPHQCVRKSELREKGDGKAEKKQN